VLMTVGLYRTIEGLVQVDYDNNDIPISRAKYEENGTSLILMHCRPRRNIDL